MNWEFPTTVKNRSLGPHLVCEIWGIFTVWNSRYLAGKFLVGQLRQSAVVKGSTAFVILPLIQGNLGACERTLSGRFSPLRSAHAQIIFSKPAHRSAPAHPVFRPLRSVFRSAHAPLTCSAPNSQVQGAKNIAPWSERTQWNLNSELCLNVLCIFENQDGGMLLLASYSKTKLLYWSGGINV